MLRCQNFAPHFTVAGLAKRMHVIIGEPCEPYSSWDPSKAFLHPVPHGPSRPPRLPHGALPCLSQWVFWPRCTQMIVALFRFAEGGDMESLITGQQKAGEPFAPGQVMDWFVQLTVALQLLHSRYVTAGRVPEAQLQGRDDTLRKVGCHWDKSPILERRQGGRLAILLPYGYSSSFPNDPIQTLGSGRPEGTEPAQKFAIPVNTEKDTTASTKPRADDGCVKRHADDIKCRMTRHVFAPRTRCPRGLGPCDIMTLERYTPWLCTRGTDF